MDGKRKPTKFKPSMRVGAVAILVRGEYAGKRVIILKLGDDGRVMVSAPYGANPMGLSLVDQTSLIGTSASVKLDLDAKVDDIDMSVFKKVVPAPPKEITEQTEEPKKYPKRVHTEGYFKTASVIDSAVEKLVKNQEVVMQEYLATPFDLDETFGVPPHQLKF